MDVGSGVLLARLGVRQTPVRVRRRSGKKDFSSYTDATQGRSRQKCPDEMRCDKYWQANLCERVLRFAVGHSNYDAVPPAWVPATTCSRTRPFSHATSAGAKRKELTFKMSHDRGWRGSCCSEHET